MDELVGNEGTAVTDIDNKLFLRRGSSNMLEMEEMLIPGDVNVQENTMGLYLDVLDGKNVARVDTSAHACTSPRCVNDPGVMVEELTVKSYDSGNLKIDASSMKGKMHNAQIKWQHLHQRAEGKLTGVWEDSGSTIFPELMNNNQQIENQNDTIDLSLREDKQPASTSGNMLLSPGGIRTKILSQSGFSQYFVKNTLKGKGVICNGPARDGLLAHIRGQNHPNAGLIDSKSAPDSIKETNVSHVHDSLSLREWLKAGHNKVDKSKSLYIFKQILDLLDSSHSQGVALQTLRPSCFKLMTSNQVLYLGSPLLENNGSEKRQLEHDLVLGANQTSKRRKHVDNQKSFRRWPQFSMLSGNGFPQDSGYGFNGESIPTRSNTHIIQCMSNNLLRGSPTSQMVTNFGCDPLEEQWYASPEDPKGMCATSASNVYSLGVLLFELLGSFESARAHDIAMMDLRQRILPPSFLSENPQEAGFCLWLLHPEPSLRPTTRDIQQSQLVSGIQQSSIKELSSSITQEDAESDLMLHFLASLKEQKQKCGTKLLDEIRCLESDISEIKSRQPNNSLAFPGPAQHKLKSSSTHGGSRLIANMNHLEHAYFSVRSTVKNPDYDTEEHEVLTSRENSTGIGPNPKKMEAAADNKPSDRLGIFFNGLCKYARYSKFEVKGILRNGDFSSMGNVICSLGFDRDEDYFATAGVSKKIKVYDFESLVNNSVDIHYPAVEMSNKSKISCICWNNYIRNYLASTDYDGVVKIWDAGTGEAISNHIEHERRTWSVDFSRVDPMKLASGSDDCTVKLWSINEKKSLTTIRSAANVCSVQFSPYSSHLLCFGSADYRTYCYDLRNISTPLCTLTGHERAVSFVKFMDPGTLISASTDNTLKLWDLNKAASFGCSTTTATSCTLTFKGHTNEKNFVGLSVADGYIACGSETNEVFAYYRSLPIPITSHKFGSIDPISGKETENESNQFVSSVCWRQKSEMVVAANSSGCLKLLQMV
ncbi:hypothetical protein Lser_V15G09966 [Lactuca serriola]